MTTDEIMRKIWSALDWIPVTEHDEKPWKPVRAAVEQLCRERDDAIRHAHENNDWTALRNRAERAEQDVKSATLSISVLQGTLKNAERERDEAIALLKEARRHIHEIAYYDLCARIDALLKEGKE